MTVNTTAPKFVEFISNYLELRPEPEVNITEAWMAAQLNDDIRMDIEVLRTAQLTGAPLPKINPRCYTLERQPDRDAYDFLATAQGQHYLTEAAKLMPHTHYWLRGPSLIGITDDRDVVTILGLPGHYRVWAVYGGGEILGGTDDLMAVSVTLEDGELAIRVLLISNEMPS